MNLIIQPHISRILTRLKINEKSTRLKSKEFESNREKISKCKSINIYTYFEIKNAFFIDIQSNHVHTMQNIDKCQKFHNELVSHPYYETKPSTPSKKNEKNEFESCFYAILGVGYEKIMRKNHNPSLTRVEQIWIGQPESNSARFESNLLMANLI